MGYDTPQLIGWYNPMIINHQSFISSIPVSFIAEIHWHQSSEDLALHLVEGAQSQRADSLGIAVFGEMEVSEVIGLPLFIIHFGLGFSMK